MDPIQILDHYRLSLLKEETLLQILARLLREGSLSGQAIAKVLNAEMRSTNHILNRLYKSALVERKGSDSWALSDLAKSLLDALRIVDIASVDLARDFTKTKADEEFLNTWLKPGREHKSLSRLSLLRSLSKAQHYWNASEVDSTVLLYAIWCMTDEVYLHMDLDHRGRGDAMLYLWQPEQAQKPQFADAESVSVKIHAGLQELHRSNLVLLNIPISSELNGAEETIRFTWLRALDAALGEGPDESFRTHCFAWHETHAATFWESMLDRPSLRDSTTTIFRERTGVETVALDVLSQELSRRLMSALARNLNRSRVGEAEPSAETAQDLETTLSALRRLGRSMTGEKVATLPVHSRAELQSLLTLLLARLKAKRSKR